MEYRIESVPSRMHQHLHYMTLDQKQLVQKTWEKVLPISESAATLFYGRLFELDLSTRPLFTHTNMPDQGRKLMNVIGMAVNGMNKLDKIIPGGKNLGRRHVSYVGNHEHYS